MIKPLGDYVLVKVHEKKDVRHGSIGIYLPDSTEIQQATVVRCGKDVDSVREKDVILFEEIEGKEIIDSSTRESYILLKDWDILGLVEDEITT